MSINGSACVYFKNENTVSVKHYSCNLHLCSMMAVYNWSLMWSNNAFTDKPSMLHNTQKYVQLKVVSEN